MYPVNIKNRNPIGSCQNKEREVFCSMLSSMINTDRFVSLDEQDKIKDVKNKKNNKRKYYYKPSKQSVTSSSHHEHFPHISKAKGCGDFSQFKKYIEANFNKDRRTFPFNTTPSGNLKVLPKQVVFESKKVSVLVADPKRTKVNVKTDRENKNQASKVLTDIDFKEHLMMPLTRMCPNPNLGRSDGEFPPIHPPPMPMPAFLSRSEITSNDDGRDMGKTIKTPSTAAEVNLSRMGYGKEPIDWNKITLPMKSELHKLLHQRITNFVNPDFLVRIGENEYRCHHLVLQCYSTFFEKVDKNSKMIELPMNNVTGVAFEALYGWMLHVGQNSYQLLRRDNILEMFMAAQYLGVKELEEQCWAFIDNEELFSEDTAFLLYLDARRLHNSAVMELMVPRIQRFFLTLVSSKDWLELSVEEISVFLRSNYICIHCEMEVFMSGVRWLMYDWQKRNCHLVDVMRCVRFGLISPWQLVDIRRNPESPEFIEITKDADVQQMVEDGVAFAIIKYWYGHESHDYYHWIDLLGLTEPASRNWAGTEKNYLTYREFIADLEFYRSQQKSDKFAHGMKQSEDSVESSVDEQGFISRETLPDMTSMPPPPPPLPPIPMKKTPGKAMPPPCPSSMVDFVARREQAINCQSKHAKH